MPRRTAPLSRSPHELCPHLLSVLAHVCIEDEDLEALEMWTEPPASCPVPPAVWARILVQRVCREVPAVARVLADRLDVRYAAEVLAVRGETPCDVQVRCDAVLACGHGPSIPGLLWAAATDPRPAVQRVASRFGFASTLFACRALVQTPAATE